MHAYEQVIYHKQKEIEAIEEQQVQLKEELFKMGDWALGLKRDLELSRREASELRSSISWKITFPLREAGAWLIRPAHQFKRYIVFA